MKNLLSLASLWLLTLLPALAQTAPQVRDLGSFTAVEVGNGIELRLAAGPVQRVEASADTPELLARLKTEVRDGILKISFESDRSAFWGRKMAIRNLRVSLTTATPLTALHASSGASVSVAGPYATESLDLGVSSGATLRASFTATALQASVSSGGVATLSGRSQRLEVRASSGGVFRGDELQTAICEAKVSSGGNINIAVQENLRAEASSGGDVRYRGAPQVVKVTSSGGSVRGR